MNFGKESKSVEKKINKKLRGGGGGVRGGGFQPKKNNMDFAYVFMLMLYIKFQVPGSSGSLVLTQTKGVTER